MNIHGFCIVVAVVVGALGQLFMKRAMLTECASGDCSLIGYLQNPGFLGFLSFGICLYFLSFICWIIALRKFDLSLAYPILSIGYIIVYFAAALPPFSEQLSLNKTAGILLIVAGVIISSQSTDRSVQAASR